MITCSDTVAAGGAEDRSGSLAASILTDLGFRTETLDVVPDDLEAIAGAVAKAAVGARVVVTTGGTGLGPRDVTVEAVMGLGAREVPGLGEAMRAAARSRVPRTDLSRGGGYLLGRVLVLCLPGSRGGVRDGLTAVGGLLGHAIAMIDGSGHGGHGTPAPQAAAHERCAYVGEQPIDVPALAAAVAAPEAGAVVTFEGRVRNHDHGREVVELTYSAHPDASRVLGDLVAKFVAGREELRVAVAHRTGVLQVGDLAFAVAVSAPHRQAAFQTCAEVVDEVKRVLPVWKLQRFADGSEEWVNCA